MDKSREEFEAWYKSQNLDNWLSIDKDDGEYLLDCTRHDWEAWQAARSPEFIREIESAAVECAAAVCLKEVHDSILAHDDRASDLDFELREWAKNNRKN